MSEVASEPTPEPSMYEDLRRQVLALDPSTVGLVAAPEDSGVWGVLFELGMPGGSASLVAFKDGTTSLYTSRGYGIIGGGQHDHIVTATRNLISMVARKLDLFRPEESTSPPEPEQVVVRALTHTGTRVAAVPDADLVDGTHLLSDVFFAGHEVIAHLRSIDETTAGENPPA